MAQPHTSLECRRLCSTEVGALGAALTDEELDAKLAELKADVRGVSVGGAVLPWPTDRPSQRVFQVAAKQAKLESLRAAGRAVSPEAKTKVLAKFKKFRVRGTRMRRAATRCGGTYAGRARRASLAPLILACVLHLVSHARAYAHRKSGCRAARR